MPLVQGKSAASFGKNIKAEMHAGKPMKQALAIAYSVKRKNMKNKGGMPSYASGGEVLNEKLHPMHEPKSLAEQVMMKRKMAHMNEGGMASLKEDYSDDSDSNDFLSAKDDSSAHELMDEDREYPDSDDMEQRTPEAAALKRKQMLSGILGSIHSKAYGR